MWFCLCFFKTLYCFLFGYNFKHFRFEGRYNLEGWVKETESRECAPLFESFALLQIQLFFLMITDKIESVIRGKVVRNKANVRRWAADLNPPCCADDVHRFRSQAICPTGRVVESLDPQSTLMSAMRTEKKQVFYLLHYNTHGHVRKNPPRSSKAIHGAGRRWVRKVLRVIGGLTRGGGRGVRIWGKCTGECRWWHCGLQCVHLKNETQIKEEELD